MPHVEKDKDFFKLAAENGFDAWSVWNSEKLKTLKEKRKHPCYLQVSDVFEWPELKPAKVDPPPSGGKVTAFLRPQPKVIDVYVGFMDEEVNARLREVIKAELDKTDRTKRRPVILVERGKVNPGDFILEWPIANYPEPARALTITQVSSKGDFTRFANVSGLTDANDSPDSILARTLTVLMEQDVPSDLEWTAKGLGYKRYIDFLALLQHRMGEKSKVALPAKQGDAAWLSVVRFGVGDDRQPPIIVIRTPEMGLQPSLMAPYVAFLFKAISSLADQLAVMQADRWRSIANPIGETREQTLKRTLAWPIRVCQFGAQGSTSGEEAFKPGKLLQVVAALFIGQEIDCTVTVKGDGASARSDIWGSGDQYRLVTENDGGYDKSKFENWQAEQNKVGVFAVISLCTPSRTYELYRKEIFGGTLAEKIKAAEEDARAKFYEFGDNPPKLPKPVDAEGSPILEIEKGIQATDLKDLIAKLTAESEKLCGEKANVAATVSFFGGQKDKEAAKKLGIVSVGMEDYHILRVLQSALATGADAKSEFPLLLGWRIDRINCDPLEIPEKVEHDFNHYIKTQVLTKVDYLRIIDWGLTGVLGPKAPACAKWAFPAQLEPAVADKLFFRYKHVPARGAVEEFVPDPLCVEIATDLVKECKENPNKAFTGNLFKDRDADAKKLQQKAEAVFAEYRSSKRDYQKGLQLIAGFLDALIAYAHFGINENPEISVQAEGNDPVRFQIDGRSDVLTTPVNVASVKGRIKLKLEGGEVVESGPGVVELKAGQKTAKVVLTFPLGTPIKTWLRPDKWTRNIKTAPSVQDLKGQEQFDGAAVDRAFYKSCNLMALQTLAATRLLT